MNKDILRITVFLVLIGWVGSCGKTDESEENSKQSTESEPKLTFTRSVAFLNAQTPPDTVAMINAAVASTQMETNQGLMNVKDLPRDKGMLFIFDKEEPRSFWMANTPLPLDIIFINESKKIVRIHHNAQPYSEDQYKSGESVKYVVETNGGYCINHDIHEGMRVSF